MDKIEIATAKIKLKFDKKVQFVSDKYLETVYLISDSNEDRIDPYRLDKIRFRQRIINTEKSLKIILENHIDKVKNKMFD